VEDLIGSPVFWTVALIVVAVEGVRYLYNYNRRRCRPCKGTGKRYGKFLFVFKTGRYKICQTCNGKGEVQAAGGRKDT
jgi:DnaJ-class molecular chaperone